MRQRKLASFRFAILTSLGLIHACGSKADSTADENGADLLEVDTDGTSEQTLSADGSDDLTATDAPALSEPESPVETSAPAPRPSTPSDEPPTATDPVDTVDLTEDPPTDPVPSLPVEDATDTAGSDSTGESDVSSSEGPDSESSEDTATDTTPPDESSACEGDTPAGDGLYTCGEITHRVSAETCASELPRERVLEGESEFFECRQDSDCTAQANGRCEPWQPTDGSNPEPGSSCGYGCTTDAECGAGFLCECGSPVGACVWAHDCVTDSDCPEDSLCARYQYFDGCGDTIGYACTSPSDLCASNADCGEGTECSWTATGRQCLSAICAIGRPFLVEGEERLAVEAERADWLLKSALNFDGLNTSERTRLACEWERIGLMEHASIAAFARFSLQLLALGAPPELLEAAQDAMTDETRHTQLAFGVASQLRGKNMGPGALGMGGAVLDANLESIVLLSVLEGCIGETVAALEAQELAASAKNKDFQELLSGIAQDEQRHAELAYKFVKWALNLEPELAGSISALVRSELARAEAAAQSFSANTSTDKEWMLPYGIYGDARRGRLRAEVLRSVVVPCIDHLLSQET